MSGRCVNEICEIIPALPCGVACPQESEFCSSFTPENALAGCFLFVQFGELPASSRVFVENKNKILVMAPYILFPFHFFCGVEVEAPGQGDYIARQVLLG